MCYDGIIKEKGHSKGSGPFLISAEVRKEMDCMTDRDLRFADEYLVDYDCKHAALRAGYSESTARNAAAWINPKNPTKPKLRALIDRKIADLSRRTGITAERVLKELASIAFVNIDDVVDRQNGSFAMDVERCDLAAVSAFTKKKGKTKENKIEFYDKLHALELIGKHLGMFDGSSTDSAKNKKENEMLESIIEAVSNVE